MQRRKAVQTPFGPMQVALGKEATLRGGGRGVDADLLSRAPSLELDDTRHAGEEGVVFTKPNIETGEKLRPALPDDDGTGLHGFTAVRFNTKILRIAVTPVSRRAAAFIGRHV